MSKKIKITEEQVKLLQSKINLDSKKKIRITEGQYNRLFVENNDILKAKDIDLSEFVKELIVFIKDLSKNPKNVPFSKYWYNLGISRRRLFEIIKNEGLVEFLGESYKAKKIGFRKKIKEIHKKICNTGLNEAGGYPAGAEFDPRAPYNEPDYEPEEKEVAKASDIVLELVYFDESGKSDNIAIFKNKKDKLLLFLTADSTTEEDTEPYEDFDNVLDYEAILHYVNDNVINGEIDICNELDTDNINKKCLYIINNNVKKFISKYYNKDVELMRLINSVKESTTSGSSGQYVDGSMFGSVINKNTGISPENAMKEVIDEEENTCKYNVIYDDNISKPFHNFKNVENFMKYLLSIGITDNVKISKSDMNDNELISHIYDFKDGEWVKKDKVEETTSTVSGPAGGPFSQTTGDLVVPFNRDLDKDRKLAGYTVTEGKLKKGQVYKNGNARRKIMDIINGELLIRQWGDKPVRDFKLRPKEFGSDWNILIERVKKLKITENQLKKIIESDNLTKTTYPNGEMVGFDDCVKFNNNKDAINGKCSEGDADGVVKKTKTKDSIIN